jgi:hypothetical protein
MNDFNYLAIVVAALAAFVISSVWYIVFDLRAPDEESPDSNAETGQPPVWKLLVEFVRSLVVAIVVAGFASNLGIVDFTDGVQLGLAFWVGFPLVLLVGSVIWENVASRAATIHAGDWLVKTVTIAVIVSVWQ